MLTNKTALVTGASRGIGAAIAKSLAKEGAFVIINYNGSKERANAVAAEITADGGKAAVYGCNVSDYSACEKMAKDIMETYGHLDILVNNAGITRDGLLMMMKEDDFDAVISANLRGTFLCMKAVSRMVRQRYGRIVNLSSVVGLRGNAGQTNYSASKAGLIGLTKSLAKELASRNVTVNAVAPGFIDTDMTAAMTETAKTATLAAIPMQRLGAPEDVARAVAFLASDSAAYITGQVLGVNGGLVI